jgi:hypothetical protein
MYFNVGVRDQERPGGGGHPPDFYLNEAGLEVGLRAMLQVTLDYLLGAGQL